MGRLSLVTVVLGVALLFGTLLHAQQQAPSPPPPPPAYGAPITLDQARAAIAAGETESKKNGWNHVFAVVDGVIHYCVANMPGGVARTSTFALNNATLPYALAIADKGYKKALLDDFHLRNGLNVYRGRVTYKAVADDLGYPYEPAEKALAA